jgi:hypothetical protein
MFTSCSIALAIQPGRGAPRISLGVQLIGPGRGFLERLVTVAPEHEDCGAPDVFFGDHGGKNAGLGRTIGSFEGFTPELGDIMAPILTAEDVDRRIAAECAYVDERGDVGIRLEPAVAIVGKYGERFRRMRQRRRRRRAQKPSRLL